MSSTTPSVRSQWPLLLLLVALTSMGPVALNILVPGVPNLVAKFETDAGTVQLTVSLFLLSLATGQLLLGPLSDRFGRRPVVLAGVALATLASFAAMAANSIGLLVAARVVQAAGAATGVVIGRAIIRDLYDRDRAAAMLGLVTTAMVVAPMVAPLIGGILDTAFGWEAIFLFVALFSLAILIWAALALPETRPPPAPGATATQQQKEWLTLLRSRPFHAYVLVTAFGAAPFFIFIGGAPYVVIDLMGSTSAVYGFWFTITSFGYMSGNFLVSRFSGRYGVRAMTGWGLGVQLASAILFIVTLSIWDHSVTMFFLPQIMMSFGNGLMLPNAIAGAISVHPQAAGAASGITGFVQMAIGAIGAQAISHALAGSANALPVPIAMMAVLTVAMLAYFRLPRDQ
jgi:DHA1 family bicyclomycin/chloramphenicol resistance-like MFS transporter